MNFGIVFSLNSYISENYTFTAKHDPGMNGKACENNKGQFDTNINPPLCMNKRLDRL